MKDQSDEPINLPINELSVIALVKKTREIVNDIFSQWKFLIICGLTGALLGLAYSIFIKPKYTAVCTFVLEESGREGMLSQYSGLASLAGFDLGNNAGDIFKGENIFQLYKSRLMLEKTLLSEVDFKGKKQKLIDWYVRDNDLLNKWKIHDDINDINFNSYPSQFNITQDSLITDIVQKFIKNDLEVDKPDKKLSIIKVAFTAKNQLFAKKFTDKLVENVNNFYVQTKITKASQNVSVLQRQVDSVKKVLNFSIFGVASAFDAAPNANPILSSLKVPSQKKQVDVQANTVIYSEMVKNLEIAKISLRQQTPLVQYIDQPVLPLTNNRVTKSTGILLGLICSLFVSCIYLLSRRLLRSVLNSTI